MRAIIHEPVVVARGPQWWEVGWGPWQFPTIGRKDDGTVVCGVQTVHDAEEDYGAELLWFKSTDNGETWEPTDAIDGALARTRLPNGDRIKIKERPPRKDLIPATEGAKPLYSIDGYADCYLFDDLNPGYVEKKIVVSRIKNGENEVKLEEADLAYWPYEIVYNLNNNGGLLPPFLFGKTRVAPDGSVWATHYQYATDPETGKEMGGHGAYFFRSTDNGHTWKLVSWMDPTKSEGAGSFLEVDIGWTNSGKAVALMRAKNIFWATSDDGGYTWNKPERFFPNDDWIEGVMPAVCMLKCGAAIATTGRPHFVIRTACDFENNGWDEGYTDICSESCSYSEIVPISDTEALVTYVDFQHPDEEDVNRKTLMAVRISFVED